MNNSILGKTVLIRVKRLWPNSSIVLEFIDNENEEIELDDEITLSQLEGLYRITNNSVSLMELTIAERFNLFKADFNEQKLEFNGDGERTLVLKVVA